MADPMTNAELAEIRAVEAAATPGPWEPNVWIETEGAEWRATGPGHDDGDDNYSSEPGCPDEQAAQCDAAFIAASRSAVPRLIAEVERLRAMETRLRVAVETFAECVYHDGHQWQFQQDATDEELRAAIGAAL